MIKDGRWLTYLAGIVSAVCYLPPSIEDTFIVAALYHISSMTAPCVAKVEQPYVANAWTRARLAARGRFALAAALAHVADDGAFAAEVDVAVEVEAVDGEGEHAEEGC